MVMQQQARGVTGVSAEGVFIGNGVSYFRVTTLPDAATLCVVFRRIEGRLSDIAARGASRSNGKYELGTNVFSAADRFR
jgi:hypothetical protein